MLTRCFLTPRSENEFLSLNVWLNENVWFLCEICGFSVDKYAVLTN